MASAKLSRQLGQDTVEKGAVLPRLQQVLGGKQVWEDMAAAFFPCGRVGGWQRELPFRARAAPGARWAAQLTLHWHRWFISHGLAPSALHHPAQQCLFLHPLTLWDRGQGATSILPLSLAASTGCGQGVHGVGGMVWLPLLSFLLWPSKAGRAWAPPFPCHHQAGEFLPFFSKMLLLLAQASVCISLSVVCFYKGSQSS